MSTRVQWLIWFTATTGLAGYFAYSLVSQPSATARTFLPGVTTHGHYQIELQCNECHSAGMGVLQDACTRCHGEDLERSTDTHPRSKFTDPGKAHLVERLDGRSCISCHQEHVPDRTQAMGLSLPSDYCWHCHQDVGEQRPSHQDLAYDSCATAGCHNYHDNRALFESFLVKHHGEPEMLDEQTVPPRELATVWAEKKPDRGPLSVTDRDVPVSVKVDEPLLTEWATTAHAAAGVNCSDCHTGDDGQWFNELSHDACSSCHSAQVETFTQGRHGMRLAVGLSPMTPGQARLPMNHDALHKELNCVACHGSHRFDTQFAAVDGCLQCHKDDHSLAYKASSHYGLWEEELAGDAPAGTGVSCATCHMPREKGDDGHYFVQHNQNNNLRPNDKMLRSACNHCHGLQYSLDALADDELIRGNFDRQPTGHVESIDMAKAWADERERLRKEREERRRKKKAAQAQETAATANKGNAKG